MGDESSVDSRQLIEQNIVAFEFGDASGGEGSGTSLYQANFSRLAYEKVTVFLILGCGE